MHQREGAPAGKLKAPTVQARTTTKRNTAHARAHCFLRDTALCLIAIGLFVASVCGADYLSDRMNALTIGAGIFALGFAFGVLLAVES